MADKKSGLPGVESLFGVKQPPESANDDPSDATPTHSEMPEQEVKSEKMVTSVRVFPSTVAMLHAIKMHEGLHDKNVTIGDVLDEAVLDLFEKKQVDSSTLELTKKLKFSKVKK